MALPSNRFLRGYFLTFSNSDGSSNLSTRDLRITFEITKDMLGFPNRAHILVYNLARKSVTLITDNFTEVELAVGYGGDLVTLFKGQIRHIISRRDGVDTITEVYAGDGESAIRDTTFSKSFAKGIQWKQIFSDIIGSFGVPTERLDGLEDKGETLNGATMVGKSAGLMDKLADSFGFNWSIQDGNMVTQDREGFDTTTPPVIITRASGMIGSPALTEIGVDVRVLMDPNIHPFRTIKIETPDVDISIGNLENRDNLPTLGEGLFRVNKVVHTGDTRGNDWYSAIIGRRVF